MPHQRGAAAGAAAHQRAHAGFQLGQREGLGHVVVGAQIQALDAFVDAVGRGQDQHRQHRAAGAQALEHLQAGHARQSQVQDQQVEGLGRQGRVGTEPVGNMVDGIARVT
ncbi:hypothetical protein D3C72_1682030 [compost metagenome]